MQGFNKFEQIARKLDFDEVEELYEFMDQYEDFDEREAQQFYIGVCYTGRINKDNWRDFLRKRYDDTGYLLSVNSREPHYDRLGWALADMNPDLVYAYQFWEYGDEDVDLEKFDYYEWARNIVERDRLGLSPAPIGETIDPDNGRYIWYWND